MRILVFLLLVGTLLLLSGLTCAEDNVPSFTDADLEKYGGDSRSEGPGPQIEPESKADRSARISPTPPPPPTLATRPNAMQPYKKRGVEKAMPSDVSGGTKPYDRQGNAELRIGENPTVNKDNYPLDKINEEQTRIRAERHEEEKLKLLEARGLSPQSKEQIERNISRVWNRFRSAFASGNMDEILNCFAVSQRSIYKSNLDALKAHLKEIAADLGNIENCKNLESNIVLIECDALKKDRGEVFSYPVEFVRDIDGNWRILFL